ncbi:ATPase, T2SS/T4P/T4SS family [Halosegnis longus]|uniref:ATPase, T2SS/T4P/T4SS family n=1 Tax=Halosegnis longus TaxID=2216012 RepID=UPI00096A37FD|nr:ATPase, T2SS/T4P/T4SS family [Salella cibi]
MFDFGDDSGCGCVARFADDTLRIDAGDCPGDGELASEPDCRATAIDALRDRDADLVSVRSAGLERRYEGATPLLVAAGRFAARVAFHDEPLADRALADPLDAARLAAGRAGLVATIAAETGLVECATATEGYETLFRPQVAPILATERVVERPPPEATLRDRYELDTGATVRLYDAPDADLPMYHLTPVELTLDGAATATLETASQRLVTDALEGQRAAGRAVRAVASDDQPVETLAAVLDKHTRGFGVLADVFADPAVTDVFASAPVGETPVRLEHEGRAVRSNVVFTPQTADALASQFRRESGRAFSRASPTLDAAVTVAGRSVRVAGVTDPVSDGTGFTFRADSRDRFRLADLVANDTLTPAVAGLLSVAVERSASILVAGGRGVGKTTLLGALLGELDAGTRTVVVEDTPELPVDSLREAGHDCQRLHVERDGSGMGPTEALRTALRLGEGAIAVGEVRGDEAVALYEAMRVGADGTTLGTIHGEDPETVRERVTTDLGVAPTAFADTDLVVTLERTDGRRVADVSEVVGRDDPAFAPLFSPGETGRIDRGNSAVVASLARPAETYSDVREAIDGRAATFR